MVAKSHALATGLFILVLGVAVAAAALWIGDYDGDYLPYEVISEHNVTGLGAQSTISYRGVPCGKVTRIELSPRNPQKIVIGLSVAKGTPITRSTYATLRHKPVTGDANLVLQDRFDNPAPLPTSPESPAKIPMQAPWQDQLLEQSGELVVRLNGVVAAAEKILTSVQSEKLGTIVANLARFSERLPVLGRQAQGSMTQIDSLIAQLKLAAGKVSTIVDDAGQLIKQGEQASEVLVQRTLPRLNSAFSEIDRSAAAIQELAQLLKNQPQALLQGQARARPGPGEQGFKRKE